MSFAQDLSVAGKTVRLTINNAGQTGLRITVSPSGSEYLYNPVLENNNIGDNGLTVTGKSVKKDIKIGNMYIKVTDTDPLTIVIEDGNRNIIQELCYNEEGFVTFNLDDNPVLGMGEGGPRTGAGFRSDTIEFDRRGRYHMMQPRWQSNEYGSRNPVPLLIGTGGWSIFVASPWVQVDLTDNSKGKLIPRGLLGVETTVQTQKDQHANLGKGMPPKDAYISGFYDIFVFNTAQPLEFMNDLADITGHAVMPPRWALGYMQSHRTLEDEDQMIDIVKTFREKRIPIDAVIYLGTGFCPRGWNTNQPSFTFNPDVFKRKPSVVIDDLHDLNVKVIAHVLPWDRDKLPGLHGSIPPAPGEKVDESHILTYWKQHVGVVEAGVDGWWPDGGDWFNLYERLERHKMYYQGSLYTTPDVRPWSIHRNGYLGISKWGGWIWSGDTQSSWKTLEGQIAVGINTSLSLTPFWGSDIGGFYPNEELTGELFARWYQFGAFCPSFRSHGKTWWTRLPWGWDLGELGPVENRANPLLSELNNPEIEIVCRKYDDLRYRLLPYNYTLAWEAREKGLPFMRAMWLHYPEDNIARKTGDQYLWGRDILIAPVYEKGATARNVYLPEGDWYDWWDNSLLKGGRTIVKKVDLQTMPLFVRAGAIIPLDPLRQYTGQKADGPTELRIYTGSDGEYSLYNDDGVSLDYITGKNCTLTDFEWDNDDRTLRIMPGDNKGVFEPHQYKIVLIPSGESKSVEFKGETVKVSFN